MSVHFSLKYIDSGEYDGLVFCPTLNPCPLSFAVWSMKDRRDDSSSSLQNFQIWHIFAVNFIQFKLPIQGTKSSRVQLSEKSERNIAQKIQQESFEVRYVTCCLLSPVLLTWNFHPQTSEVLFSCLPLSMYRNRWGNMVYLFKLNYGVKLWLRFFFTVIWAVAVWTEMLICFSSNRPRPSDCATNLVTVIHFESNLQPKRIVLCFFSSFFVVCSWFPERKKWKTVNAMKFFCPSRAVDTPAFSPGFWRESPKAVKDDGISSPLYIACTQQWMSSVKRQSTFRKIITIIIIMNELTQVP